MKRTAFIALLLIFVLISATCEPPSYRNVDSGLFTIAANAIPNGYAANGAAETKFLEQDGYGRILFAYTATTPDIAYSELYALLICQQRGNECVAYYEDECFVVKNGKTPFDESEIAALKAQNDWDCPILEEKLTWRKIVQGGKDISGSIGWFESMSVAEEIIQMRIGPISGSNIMVSDVDSNGKTLLFAQYWLGRTQEDSQRCFIMIEQDGSYVEDVCYEELASLYHYQEQLHTFKEKNGWVFGKRSVASEE